MVRGGTAGRVSIEWVVRSLREFGMLSVQELAHRFDLVVIDHPHIGTMAESGCVVPLDDFVDADTWATIAANSPGGSHESYHYGGHQWAFAIDAACQTSAWRPDRLSSPPTTWEQVFTLAQGGRVMWPLCAVDAAASFMTLTVERGEECARTDEYFVSRDVGRWALATMYDVARPSDPQCLVANPIQVLDAMAEGDDVTYSPLTFCYVNYSRDEHLGRHRVAFGNIPALDGRSGPRGALLGGAGLAISATSDAVMDAVAYATYVASAPVQNGLYYRAGGQPAHAAAWSNPSLDEPSGHFFSGVAPVLEKSWTRPTGPGFASFQNAMIELFAEWYDHAPAPTTFLDKLDELYRSSLATDPARVRH